MDETVSELEFHAHVRNYPFYFKGMTKEDFNSLLPLFIDRWEDWTAGRLEFPPLALRTRENVRAALEKKRFNGMYWE